MENGNSAGKGEARRQGARAQERAMLNRLFEGDPDALIVVDAGGHMVRANAQAESMFGYPREELLGQPVEILLPERLSEQHQKQRAAFLAQPHIRPMGAGLELLGRRKDASEFPVDIMLSPLDLATGHFVLANIRDVTDRKQAEDALRTSEAQLRLALDAAHMTVWELNLSSGQLSLPEGIERIAGLTPDSFGRTLEEFLAQVARPDREMVAQAIAHSRNTGTDYNVEFREVFPDGEIHWLASSGKVLTDENGQPVRMLGVCADVTQRKLIEEELTLRSIMLRHMAEGVCLVRAGDGVIVYANPRFEQMFGYGADELRGQPLALINTTSAETGTPEQGEATFGNEEFCETVYQACYPKKDGTSLWCQVRTAAFEHPEHGIVWVAVYEDITALQQAHEALLESRDELEARVRTRTAELTQINDELQLEVAERRQAQAQRERLMQRLVSVQEEERSRIARELHDQMGQLVAALRLELSALQELGHCPPPAHQRVTRIQDITAEIARQMRHLAWELRPPRLHGRGIHETLRSYIEDWTLLSRIEVDFYCHGLEAVDDLPPYLEITLYRIVQESLTNVLKHAKASHVSVVVERRPDQMLATIEDDGGGFDYESLPAPSARSSLGLIGMQERAALMGGALEIESKPGLGTTIFLRMPLGSGNRKKEEDDE